MVLTCVFVENVNTCALQALYDKILAMLRWIGTPLLGDGESGRLAIYATRDAS